MLKLIIFEGIDKTGKTTLFKAYRKATKWQPLCWDRGPGSNIVYNRVYDREDKSKQLYKAEQFLEDNFIVYLVYCYTRVDLTERRIEKAGEPLLVRQTYESAKYIYEYNYLEKTPFTRIIRLDTGKNTVEECLGALLAFTGFTFTGEEK